MMDMNETNLEEPQILPLTKTDWIRFGALKVQARSRKIWQIVAIVAMIGIVMVAVTDGWLFMRRQIRTEQLLYRLESLSKQNRTLASRLSSMQLAMKKNGHLINATANEKNQLAIEKGILQAQTELLIKQIKTLEASIQSNNSDSPENTFSQDSNSAQQRLAPPQKPQQSKHTSPEQTPEFAEVKKLSYAP
ncbi:MAG: hypothetical protein ACYTFK_08015 [Planctomycetota bacterium]|jgi:hypothetical protein